MVMKKKQTTPSIFEKYRSNIKYFEHLKSLLEAYETYKISQALQDEYRQKQRELNYIFEYDRISGELENNRLPLTTKKQLDERKEKLMKAIKYHLDVNDVK